MHRFDEFLTSGVAKVALSPREQWAVYRFACSTGRDELLKALLTREDLDLDPALDAEIGSSTSAQVLVWWLSRPGRSSAEAAAMVSKERRVTVLEAVAQIQGHSHNVYELLLTFGHPRVHLALLGNESARAQHERAAKALAAGFRPSSTSPRADVVLDALQSTPHVVDAAVCSGTDLYLVTKLVSANLGPTAAAHAFDVLCAELSAGLGPVDPATLALQGRTRVWELHNRLGRVCGALVTLVPAVPSGRVGALAAELETYREALRSANRSASPLHTSLWGLLVALDNARLGESSPLNRIKSATDPAEIDVAVDEALQGPPPSLEMSHQLAVAVLTNRCATADQVRQALSRMGQRVGVHVVGELARGWAGFRAHEVEFAVKILDADPVLFTEVFGDEAPQVWLEAVEVDLARTGRLRLSHLRHPFAPSGLVRRASLADVAIRNSYASSDIDDVASGVFRSVLALSVSQAAAEVVALAFEVGLDEVGTLMDLAEAPGVLAGPTSELCRDIVRSLRTNIGFRPLEAVVALNAEADRPDAVAFFETVAVLARKFHGPLPELFTAARRLNGRV
jgi:hypothetical protein